MSTCKLCYVSDPSIFIILGNIISITTNEDDKLGSYFHINLTHELFLHFSCENWFIAEVW